MTPYAASLAARPQAKQSTAAGAPHVRPLRRQVWCRTSAATQNTRATSALRLAIQVAGNACPSSRANSNAARGAEAPAVRRNSTVAAATSSASHSKLCRCINHGVRGHRA